MIVYHRTPHADPILEGGFRNGEGSYGLQHHTLRGVFVSEVPLDINEGAAGEDLLEVTLPHDEHRYTDFELIEKAKTYREWCIPAEVLNADAVVRRVTTEEEDALATAHLRKSLKARIATCMDDETRGRLESLLEGLDAG